MFQTTFKTGLVQHARKALGGCVVLGGALLATLPSGAFAAKTVTGDAPTTGTGTAAFPYAISSLSNLVWMGENVSSSTGKHYKLTRNINASSTATWNDAGTSITFKEGFSPIGTTTNTFQGVFDGNKKQITGLNINRPTSGTLGLFGATSGATIKNLSLTGSVKGGGSEENSGVGALIGKATDTSVTACSSACQVTGLAEATGGLIGYTSGTLPAVIQSCRVSGKVTGMMATGGLVGAAFFDDSGDSDTTKSLIVNCTVTGSIVGTTQSGKDENACGGLVGYCEGWDVADCLAKGSVTCMGGYVGGLIGSHMGDNEDDMVYLLGCDATGVVKGYSNVGGLVGYTEYVNLSDCHATGAVSAAYEYAGGLVGEAEDTTITLSTAKGHVTGVYDVGGLIGRAMDCLLGSETVSGAGCRAYGAVLGSQSVGGLVGYNSSSDVFDCFAYGSVAADSIAGGLIGKNRNSKGTVTSCSSKGNVRATMVAGGLIGTTDGDVTNCSATGKVAGDYMVGGLIAQNNEANISYSYATGGVIGNTMVGGLCGQNMGGEIEQCCAKGKVTGDMIVGGLLGANISGESTLGDVVNSWASGKVTGNYAIGGLVGWNESTVETSYSIGQVADDTAEYAGGLVGYNEGAVTHSYWNYQTSGMDTSNGGTALSTAAFKSGSAATGFLVGFNNGYWSLVKEFYPVFSPRI